MRILTGGYQPAVLPPRFRGDSSDPFERRQAVEWAAPALSDDRCRRSGGDAQTAGKYRRAVGVDARRQTWGLRPHRVRPRRLRQLDPAGRDTGFPCAPNRLADTCGLEESLVPLHGTPPVRRLAYATAPATSTATTSPRGWQRLFRATSQPQRRSSQTRADRAAYGGDRESRRYSVGE